MMAVFNFFVTLFFLSATASRTAVSRPTPLSELTTRELLMRESTSLKSFSGGYRIVFSKNGTELCQFQHFEKEREIHKSETVIVYTAQYKGEKVIVKQYLKPEDFRSLRMEEIILNRLKHPNLSEGICTFRDLSNSIHLVMKYDTLTTLFDRLEEPEADDPEIQRKIALQMVSVLMYLDSEKIIHNDIKPENILVNKEWEIKLIDFGESVYLPEERCYQDAGSPLFMAPEKLFGKIYNNSVDWYAFGITLYELVSKENPFGHIDNRQKLEEAVMEEIPQLKNPVVNDFISKLCHKDEKHRWYPANVAEENILKHEFLRGASLEHATRDSVVELGKKTDERHEQNPLVLG